MMNSPLGSYELKYVKSGDPAPTPEELEKIKAKAIGQLDCYSSDPALVKEWHLRNDAASASCDDGGVVATRLHRLVLVFHGGDCVLAEEVSDIPKAK